MKTHLLKFSSLGALFALVASTFYVFFGPKGWFGFPEPLWAQILFYPGMCAGLASWEVFRLKLPGCYAAGVFAMTLTGALLGLVTGCVVQFYQRRCRLQPGAAATFAEGAADSSKANTPPVTGAK